MSEGAAAQPLVFASKAETLECLRPLLKGARVLPQLCFTAVQWRADAGAVLAQLLASDWLANSEKLIVRSSAAAEDRPGQSLAGHFESIRDVVPMALRAAIEQVVASFGAESSPQDQVFVQPMLRAAMSGVAFTRDPNTDAPYLVINFEEAGDTAAVTGGHADELKTFVYWKGRAVPCPAPLNQVEQLANELEQLFGVQPLDIEFAFDHAGELYLFQVRPLVISGALGGQSMDVAQHQQLLSGVAEKIALSNRPHPYLRGRRTLYGVMPDWNPAEIIGIRPRPLALSLYRNLITDNVWAYQRHNYGYRNLRSFPLLLSFHGLPYIDVRVSFNSFIPGSLSDALADRLVDCYVDQLAAAPVLHDKVEFEIVYSCYTFDLTDRLRRLEGFGFTRRECDELSAALRQLTNRIVNRDTGLWRIDSEKISILERRQADLRQADMDIVSRLYWLLEDCKRYGTLPFAGLARAGFVAVQMLKSLVSVGALTSEQYDAFLASLETVSGRMGRDACRMSRPEFLRHYGHLRPGTYDILSPRYDESPERYLGPETELAADTPAPHPSFGLTLPQMRRIDDLLRQHHLDLDVVGLFEFLQAGIQGREHAKFVFTRSLSDALSLLGELGSLHGLDREAMSFFDAAQIPDLYASSQDIGATLRHGIAQGRARYAETQRIMLPPLIGSTDDVWAFHMPPSDPNFITQNIANGLVLPHTAPRENLRGAIVMIPSADPGFDWLFSLGIAGFVTAYGGVNSHMAIRAGELNLPAVIGAGETLFNRWSRARRLSIDCATRRVELVE